MVKMGSPSKCYSRPVSRLESLPTELLEDIFLESVNFELPATSSYLMQALTSKRLYLDVAHRVLHEPFHWLGQGECYSVLRRNDVHFSIECGRLKWEACSKLNCTFCLKGNDLGFEDWRIVKHALLPQLRSVDWSEFRQPNVQSRLLECRFFTWHFFLDLARQSHSFFLNEFEKASTLDFFQMGMSETFDSYQLGFWSKLTPDGVVTGFKEFTFKYDPSRDAKSQTSRSLSWGWHWYPPWLHFKSGSLLPIKLLRGPWPHGKQMLLFWLLNPGPVYCRQITGEISTLGLTTGRVEQTLTDAIRDNIDWLVEYLVIRAEIPVTPAALRQALDRKPFPFNIVSTCLYAICHMVKLSHMELAPFETTLEQFLLQREADEAKLAIHLDRTSNLFSSISVARWTRVNSSFWKERTEKDDEYQPPKDPIGYYFSDNTDMANLMEDYHLECSLLDENSKIEDLPEDSTLHRILMKDIRSEEARALDRIEQDREWEEWLERNNG